MSVKPPFQCPRSAPSKDPSRARASPARPCPSLRLSSGRRTPLGRLLQVLAPGRGRLGIPETSRDTRDGLWTAVPWGNRFRRCCQTAIGRFTEQVQGGGHGVREATVGRAVVRKGVRGGVAGQGRTGSPRPAQRWRWHSRRGHQAKAERRLKRRLHLTMTEGNAC